VPHGEFPCEPIVTITQKTFHSRAEHRWPVAIALITAIALFILLPGSFFPTLRYLISGICAVLLLVLIVLNPHRLNKEAVWSRALSVSVAVVLLVANQFALVLLLYQLINVGRSDAPGILVAAVQVWATNVIAYSLIFWEIDRGGPIVRRREAREDQPAPDFRFPQDDYDQNWLPEYFDYLYFSATNSTAFSPTDTMPVTIRAKALMLAESVSGFAILALVIARAVNVVAAS
jgi:uncharacterized membrane protein